MKSAVSFLPLSYPPVPRSHRSEHWMGMAVLGWALASGAWAAEPQVPFALRDLNPASPRLGQTVTSADYGEWVSVYYFGNEA